MLERYASVERELELTFQFSPEPIRAAQPRFRADIYNGKPRGGEWVMDFVKLERRLGFLRATTQKLILIYGFFHLKVDASEYTQIWLRTFSTVLLLSHQRWGLRSVTTSFVLFSSECSCRSICSSTIHCFIINPPEMRLITRQCLQSCAKINQAEILKKEQTAPKTLNSGQRQKVGGV